MPENETPPAEQAPPWGSEEEFNPEKAWGLIQGLRADKEKLASRRVMTDEEAAHLTEYRTLLDASQSDMQRTQTELNRWQTEADTWRKAAVGSTIQALASDFADPSDAIAALSDGQYLDAGGQIDEARIKQDLAAVLDKKPHWRRPDGAPAARTPAPNPAQGTSGAGAAPLSPADQFAELIRGQLS